jgi:transcriptional regulator with XRE-family HTH domain
MWTYDQTAVGKRIEALLQARKLRKKDFADQLERHPTRVSKYLKGEELNAEKLGEIAEILKCSTDYLLGRTSGTFVTGEEEALVAEDEGEWLKNDARRDLLIAVKEFVRDPDADEEAIRALLSNVKVFRRKVGQLK